jgi:predicted transcriptional regulator
MVDNWAVEGRTQRTDLILNILRRNKKDGREISYKKLLQFLYEQHISPSLARKYFNELSDMGMIKFDPLMDSIEYIGNDAKSAKKEFDTDRVASGAKKTPEK